MNIGDRQLCFDFLMKVTGRSKEEAQQFVFTLNKNERTRLLSDAKEWRAMGSPGRDRNPPVAVATQQVSTSEAPEEIASDVDRPVRKKAKKVLFSLLLPPAELEALRELSDETGETVSYHVRQAIRSYLRRQSDD